MRTGAPAGHTGYFHEALYYRSIDDLLAVIVPFLRGGLEAGEPVVVALGGPHADAVRDAIPELPAACFLEGGSMYERPASAIRAYRELLAGHVADGANQIRIIGELAPSAFGATWDWWARYESAINHAYNDYPLWSMCAYDEDSTPPAVLADVAETHPRIARVDGHPASPRYVDPVSFLTQTRSSTVDPIVANAPAFTLIDPTPAAARLAVRDVAGLMLTPQVLDELVVAVSEVVTNGLRHGRPPVRVRMWLDGTRAVVTVRDEGSGPTDPYAGLLPQFNGGLGGYGLWLAHQLCSYVGFDREDGFTVRLTAGPPP